jgi:hypothetical protein
LCGAAFFASRQPPGLVAGTRALENLEQAIKAAFCQFQSVSGCPPTHHSLAGLVKRVLGHPFPLVGREIIIRILLTIVDA